MRDESHDPRPDHRTVLITGASKRLGAAMALELGQRGWDVVVHYGSSAAEARELVAELRESGRGAWCLSADLSRPEECRTLLPRARELAGPVHALINNASVFPKSTLMEFEPDELHANIQLHGIAPLLLARSLAEDPAALHVLNLLDSKITGPDDEHVAYHLSKRLLASLTSLLARELAPGIAVNAIAPGAMLPASGDSAEQFAKLANSVPLRRTGEPGDVAQAAAFLLDSRFITGQTLFVDGGRHLNGRLYG